jgi:uncharacterized repeat protein (TIGR01451 family)
MAANPILLSPKAVHISSIETTHLINDSRGSFGVLQVLFSFTTSLNREFKELSLHVVSLDSNKTVLDSDSGTGDGIGAVISIPNSELGPSQKLTQGEVKTKLVELALDADLGTRQNVRPFPITVDIHGVCDNSKVTGRLLAKKTYGPDDAEYTVKAGTLGEDPNIPPGGTTIDLVVLDINNNRFKLSEISNGDVLRLKVNRAAVSFAEIPNPNPALTTKYYMAEGKGFDIVFNYGTPYDIVYIGSVEATNVYNFPLSEEMPLEIFTSIVNIRLDSSAPSDTGIVGTDFSYNVWVVNDGPDTATNVTLIANLHHSLSYVSSELTQGTCSVGGNTITCNLGDITSGSDVGVLVNVTPTTEGSISSTFTVSALERDANIDNNKISITTVVGG